MRYVLALLGILIVAAGIGWLNAQQGVVVEAVLDLME